MIQLYIFLVTYFGIGIALALKTKSRGVVADALFVTLWIVYFYDDYRNGRL